MSAIIFDTETTGVDEPELVESAWLSIDIDGNVNAAEASRWKPSKPIALGAMATHHIMDEDLVDAPPATGFALPDGVEYLIGYKVDFDWEVIGKPNIKRIDVMAMCRSLWPTADSHTQGAMLYMLARDKARERLRSAHSAEQDVRICRMILLRVLAQAGPFTTFEELWHASERMRVPTVMSFGKHKGMAIKDVPYDYKRWLLKQPDVDPYLTKALLGQR